MAGIEQPPQSPEEVDKKIQELRQQMQDIEGQYEAVFSQPSVYDFAAKNGLQLQDVRVLLEDIASIADLIGDGFISPWEAPYRDDIDKYLTILNSWQHMDVLPEEIRLMFFKHIDYLASILLSRSLGVNTPKTISGMLTSIRNKLWWNFNQGLSSRKQN